MNNEETTIIETTVLQDIQNSQFDNMESSLQNIEVILWILLVGLSAYVVLKVFYKTISNFI